MPGAFTETETATRQGQFGKWDVYPLIWQETARISDRRQTTNSIYLSINSLLLGGIALLAQQSQLQSFALLVVQVVVAGAGFLLANQWYKILEKYRLLLKMRYATLESIEDMPGFPGAVKMYIIERGNTATYGFSRVEEFIPKLFRALYVLGTVLLIAGTVAVKMGVGAWLSRHVILPTLQ
jgi:hypothetical protein